MSRKFAWFWPLALVVLIADFFTKRIADERLQPPHVPREIVGDVVRFTLTYNPGAAFSMSLGEHSRWGFTVLALIVLGVLGYIYRSVESTDRWQGAALGLVTGGALGNLVDRLRWHRGVVDFIDIGIGDVRFWTFNVADMGVSIGAIMLAFVMLRQPSPPPVTSQ
jgi:signal peptidase II